MLDWEYSVTLPYGILFESHRYYGHVLFCPCEIAIHFFLQQNVLMRPPRYYC